MADRAALELVASFFTLSGAASPTRPATPSPSAAGPPPTPGSPGSGCTPTTCPAPSPPASTSPGCGPCWPSTGLRVVEIEFLGGWAFDGPADAGPRSRRIEAVADAFGGRHVSAGEFRGDDPARPRRAPRPRLGALRRPARRRGLLVALEAFPWSALPDPASRSSCCAGPRRPQRRADDRRLALLQRRRRPGAAGRPARPAGSPRCSSTTARWCTRTSCSTPGPGAGCPARASSTSSA